MSDLKVVLLQQPLVWMDGEANFRHFEQALAEIATADLILLPEMFTTGFAMEAAASSLPEPVVIQWLQCQAIRFDAMIGGSVALHTETGAVNRFLLVTPQGVVHRYDKRHLFRMGDEHQYYQAGQQRVTVEWRGWRILPQICYDLRFPVFSRNRNDYDLALYVASWPAPRSQHWQALLLARAIENQAYVMGCNRVGEDIHRQSYSGDSRIISPTGELLAAPPAHQPAVLQQVLSLDELRAFRDRFPAWRDADNFSLSDQ
ncbi:MULTISPECIES: amidohydrolase [Tatumella]|uniref:Amidohydrolase n=1 Tax=Tatumella punctata TaxID=399969 RepID=A0ABW1VRK9_9GAMM|nr:MULTISPECIES: amidohydrolase [unclassified Tatumella]MBS0857018.1 amidohydrolase [Tatumella sp. JGM16]MBS0878332.1 amidohydrolase [Tatumella sp. JGM82]MBS0891821.1 amidohydrolase [Tatumella sp. JGM94]MBS0894624.1 amidohydrolase [Tatumella sp. JGM130]MBS0903046.1 amidohydrolase [Tatumella sp. JGM100]